MAKSAGITDETPLRVLALDGGGIRGIIPALVLVELERRSGRPTAELFDLIAGTSTGGIIALALTRPGPDGTPAWTAEHVVELYEHEGPLIFAQGPLHSLHGIFDERYDASKLQAVLEHYCGSSRLSDSTTPVLIPAYDVVSRDVFLFNSSLAAEDPAHDYPASFVGRAASAAPTYFEPPATPGEELVFVDGAVFANNPAMCAFTEAQRLRPGSAVALVSLGAGSQTRALRWSEIRHWGLAQWARPILHVVLDGVSIAVDQQLRALLGPERYWRFQVELVHARDDIDDASPRNLALLREEAARLIDAQSEELDKVVERLQACQSLPTV